MSSEVITQNDLQNVLNGVLPYVPPITDKIDGCIMKCTYNSSMATSANAIFNPTLSIIIGNGETFSVDSTTNRIIVKKACTCLVVTACVFSAISATGSMKVVALGKNSSASEQTMGASGYLQAWDSTASVDYAPFSENDQLHFTGRIGSGTATLRQANIIIIRLN